jgi:predicted outer membrane repeat protein
VDLLATSPSSKWRINDCQFISNYAPQGGAIWMSYTHLGNELQLIDNLFFNNSATLQGGKLL